MVLDPAQRVEDTSKGRLMHHIFEMLGGEMGGHSASMGART